MVDSGATALFISERFVREHKIFRHPLKREILLRNIDSSSNKAGTISHYARLPLKIGDKHEKTEFFITNIGPENVILGLPWLRRNNPQIDWEVLEL